MTQEQLRSFFADLSKQARHDGADVELSVGTGDSFSASYQMRKLKKYAADQSQAAVLRVLYGKGTGLSTTENLSTEALKQAYQEALRSAQDLHKAAAPDKLEPALLGAAKVLDLDGLYHSDYSDVSSTQKLAWAEELEAVALDFDKRVTNVPYSGFSHSSSRRFLFNSKGVDLSSKSSSLSGYSYALAKEGDDSKMAGLASFARDPKAFNAEKLARTAAERSLSLLGATQPKTGKWNVVFENEVAAELVGLMIAHFSAKSLDEGTSLLGGKRGETVFSKIFSWTDDPFQAHLPAARPFDAEGAPSQRTPLVKQGRLENYLTNSYYARKLNLPHTAHAVRGAGELDVASSNVIVEKGTKTAGDLLTMESDLILITEITAIHSGYKETTGDFSLPASGYLYRNGEKTAALHQFVISGNLLDLLARVSALSNRWNDNGDSTLCPDMFVPDVSIAGQS
jgi:PmbA protein